MDMGKTPCIFLYFLPLRDDDDDDGILLLLFFSLILTHFVFLFGWGVGFFNDFVDVT